MEPVFILFECDYWSLFVDVVVIFADNFWLVVNSRELIAR